MVKINKMAANQMVHLVWPSLLLTLLQAFVTAFDATLAGHIGRDALATITLIYPFFLLMQAVSLSGFGGAVAANVSKAAASNKSTVVTKAIFAALGLSLAMGLFCSFLFFSLGQYLIQHFVSSKHIAHMAFRYGFWMIGFAPVFWICNCLLSIARGLGMVKPILGAACLVYPLQMFVVGVLIFSGGAQDVATLSVASCIGIAAIGFLIGFRLLQHPCFILELNIVKDDMKATISSLISVGVFTSISSVITGASLILLSVLVASRFGLDALGGFGVVFRIEVILMSLASCIGVAVVTIGARAFGRHDIATTIQVGSIGVFSTLTLIGFFGIMLAIQPDFVLRFFILNPESLSIASSYLHIVGWSYPLMALGFASFFVGQSLGRPRWFFAAALVRFLFLLLIAWLMPMSLPSFMQLIAAAYCLFGVLALAALAHQRSKLLLDDQRFGGLPVHAKAIRS